jgi:hypothetical protein
MKNYMVRLHHLLGKTRKDGLRPETVKEGLSLQEAETWARKYAQSNNPAHDVCIEQKLEDGSVRFIKTIYRAGIGMMREE